MGNYWIAVIVFFTGWLICGYLAYGYEYAFQKRFSEYTLMSEKRIREAALMSFWLGFFSLAILFIEGEARYGRRYPWQDSLTRCGRKLSR